MDELDLAEGLPARKFEAAASAHLAPDPAPQPAAPRRRTRALLLAIGGLASVALGGSIALWRFAPRSPIVLLGSGVERSRFLAPLQTSVAPGAAEEVAPFSGFTLSIDSEPPGAVITIDGVQHGEAPVLAGLDCAPGARIDIAGEKHGFPVARIATVCRRDTLVKLTVRLRK